MTARVEPWRRPAAWALLLVVVVVIALVVYVRSAAGSGDGAADPVLGRPAPGLHGQTLDGSDFRLSPGRPTIVNVWASWCGPCRHELPAIASFARSRAGKDLRVVTVDTRDGPAAARSFLHELGVRGLLTVQDPSGRVAVAWGATGIPETYVVDARGIVRAHVIGGVTRDWLEEQAHRWGRT